MKQIIWAAIALLMVGCGGKTTLNPEESMVNAEKYAHTIDSLVAKKLSIRSLSDFKIIDRTWAVQIGYVDGKVAVVKMKATDGVASRWWLYPDTATGKILYFKEETIREEKAVRNRIVFNENDSALLALASNQPYQAQGTKDIRLNGKALGEMLLQTIQGVEADRSDLSKEVNAARRENAQMVAEGADWFMVVNPSTGQVSFTKTGSTPMLFVYSNPDSGPNNESLYSFNSESNGRLELTVVSKYCYNRQGKAYPYTVVVKVGGKSVAGCGLPLQ